MLVWSRRSAACKVSRRLLMTRSRSKTVVYGVIGSTTGSGPVSLGSSPSRPAILARSAPDRPTIWPGRSRIARVPQVVSGLPGGGADSTPPLCSGLARRPLTAVAPVRIRSGVQSPKGPDQQRLVRALRHLGWSTPGRDAQRVAARRDARAGTTIAAATKCRVISVAADPASNHPNATSGTTDSAVSATVVRTKVARGRRALRARTAAMPTPMSEKTNVSCANPASGMVVPAGSVNETPAADATAARTVVVTEAATAATTPCLQTDRRPVVVAPEVASAGVAAMWVVGCGRGGHCVTPCCGGRPVRPLHVLSTNEVGAIRQTDLRHLSSTDDFALEILCQVVVSAGGCSW